MQAARLQLSVPTWASGTTPVCRPAPVAAHMLRRPSASGAGVQWSAGMKASVCTHSANRASLPRQAPKVLGLRRQAGRCRAATTSGSVGEDIAVVIVDHGSRKRDSNDMLVHFGLVYQQMTGAKIVEIAHMEIAEPTIEQAVGKCAAAGAKTVVVAPYFLSKGRHIQEDIPKLLAEAQVKHTGVKCVLAGPIGVDPLMAQIIHNRVESALRTAV